MRRVGRLATWCHEKASKGPELICPNIVLRQTNHVGHENLDRWMQIPSCYLFVQFVPESNNDIHKLGGYSDPKQKKIGPKSFQDQFTLEPLCRIWRCMSEVVREIGWEMSSENRYTPHSMHPQRPYLFILHYFLYFGAFPFRAYLQHLSTAMAAHLAMHHCA